MSAIAALHEFDGFGKIPRLRRNCIITEKIDGTNAAVVVQSLPTQEAYDAAHFDPNVVGIAYGPTGDPLAIRAQSRKRFITPQVDNYGFASWVSRNLADLAMLGEGRHFGEWWGQGIKRAYGLSEKRFSLFNVARWSDHDDPDRPRRPECCAVVPVIYDGLFTTDAVDMALASLGAGGSLAAPGFDRPEGVIVYHVAAGTYAKVLLENDELPKSMAEAER